MVRAELGNNRTAGKNTNHPTSGVASPKIWWGPKYLGVAKGLILGE